MNIDFDDVLCDNKLFCDYVKRYETVAAFFAHDPADRAGYSSVMAQLAGRQYQREKLSNLLREQNMRWGASPETFKNIDKLAGNGSFAIVTGQQTGLFGGPLYTVLKAITTVRLARFIEEKHGVSCAPIFWVDSDDHDFSEATNCVFVDGDGQLKHFSLIPPVEGERLPMAGYVLGDEIEEIKQQVMHCLGGQGPDSISSLLESVYRPGTLYLDAFSSLMHRLLEGKGLVLLSPSGRSFKSIALPFFLNEIETAPESTVLLDKTMAELTAAGYHGQVKGRPERVNLFYHDPRRRSLYAREGRFFIDGHPASLSHGEMKELVEREPENFSPNVVLRPLVQNFVLPALAYVAGPAEVAYWGEMKELHHFFGVTFPLVYPRMSLTVLEGKIKKILEKHGLSLADSFGNRGRNMEEYFSRTLPGGIQEQMNTYMKRLESLLGPIEEAAAGMDVNLKPAFRHFLGKTRQQWDQLERKVAGAYSQKDEQFQRQSRKVRMTLFPGEGLQERTLNVLQFYANHGKAFIERLFEEPAFAPPWSHQIMEI